MEKLTFRNRSRLAAAAAAAGLAVALTGCAESDDGSDDTAAVPEQQPAEQEEVTMSLATPGDGETVTLPFEVSVDSNVELGSIADEVHHLHIWFDGMVEDTLIIEDSGTMIEDAPDGETTMTVQVHTFDHQPASDPTMVSLTVEGGNGAGGETEEDSERTGPYDNY